MKKNIVYITALLAGSLFTAGSCTDNFEKYNSDKTGLTDDLKKGDYHNIGIPLNIVQQGIYFNYDWGSGKNWPYQTMQNLSADMFSGYMHDFNNFNGGSSNSDYNLMDGWNGSFWGNTMKYILPEVKNAEEITEQDYPASYGITKILKVELMHRLSDYYGPIIYTHFGDSKTGSQPDTQKEAYYAFFQDLDIAVSKIQESLKANPGLYDFDKFDILTHGHKNNAYWLKFANSLRLRLAIRIAMADPVKAQAEARKALDPQNGGLFETDDEMIAVSTATGYSNPVGEINRGWGEVYMNASMESILKGYEDPRLPKFFEPATNEKCAGQYRGIRQGTKFNHQNYKGLSVIYINPGSDAILMTAAEVWFLRAEAALRGWSSEDAGVCYKKGVNTSFEQWKADGVNDYLNSDNVAADFVDVLDPSNNIQAKCLVSPKWDPSANPEIKLEKIITQKWLAVFPEGCEAWAEQRRTGYPRLFPVKYNSSKGTIDTEIMIRRLNFPVDIISSNPEQYKALVNALGGADNGGTRLWWDTGKNF